VNPAPKRVRADSASSPAEDPRREEPEPDGEERPRSSRDPSEEEVDSDKLLGPILGW
jgi:hypothetical protein